MMNKTNEILVARTKEQAFDTITAMVTGKKDTDPAMLIATIQNFKTMIDFQVASIERMEEEAAESRQEA